MKKLNWLVVVATLATSVTPALAQQKPFQPSSTATTGKTVKVTANNTPTSVPGTVPSTAAFSLLVANTGTVIVFVRMSAEATPVATAADVPVAAGTVRVFSNPVPTGTLGVAVLSSTASTNDIYFTPGNGGM